MPKVTAAMVKSLRAATGAGMMDCKKALNEAEGDEERARELLRKRGLASAKKKAGRAATEGVVHAYIHGGGRVGVLLEVNCETDFVSGTDDFKEFTHGVAMHIAATNPMAVRREDIPAEALENERRILTEQAQASGKPEAVIEKMVTGRMRKFYEENCLLDQAYVLDSDRTVGDVQTAIVAKLGENISIRRFTRFVCGEGLEKKADDFAAEVAAMTGA